MLKGMNQSTESTDLALSLKILIGFCIQWYTLYIWYNYKDNVLHDYLSEFQGDIMMISLNSNVISL